MTLTQILMLGLIVMGAGVLVAMVGMFFLVRSIDRALEDLRELPWRDE